MPEIVHICFDSVDRYKGEYKVIRLDDAMISEYIDLPDFVWERRKNQQFTRTFFSDLLRVALLSTYGGVWLDATILLTGKLPKEYEDLDFFMYQRSEAQPNKTYWENTYAYYFGWDIDYKVRVLDEKAATAAPVRVIIRSTDGESQWSTVGVSTNVIEASLTALTDSVEYGIYINRE